MTVLAVSARARRRYAPALLLVALLVPACSGYLDFDKQTLVAVSLPERDEVRVLLIYEGFCLGGPDRKKESDKEGDLNNARQQLEVFFAKKRAFYFGTPLFAVELPGKASDVPLTEAEKKDQAFVRKHLSISDAALFLNEGSKFSGYQVLLIRQASQFIEGLNERITAYYAEGMADPHKRQQWDAETARQFQQALSARHVWLRLEPGRVSYTFPVSPRVTTDVKRDLLSDIFGLKTFPTQVAPAKDRLDVPDKATSKEPTFDEILQRHRKEREHFAAFLSDAPLSIDQRRDRLTVSLGLGDGEPIRVTSPHYAPKPGRHEAELLAHAQALGIAFKKDATTKGLIADFLREHAPAKRRER